jgi:hypothetical protein
MPELWVLVLAQWILGVLAGSAATNLIVTSDLFFPLRNLTAVAVVLSGRRTLFIWKFLNGLVSCRYCVSVWMGMALAIDLPGGITGEPISDFTIRALALHRLIVLVD